VALNVARSHASPHITEVFFLFIDEDKARINHLQFEISKLDLPAKFTVKCAHREFEDIVTQLLDRLDSLGLSIAPTFVFIDPFGFAGVPYSLVSRLLNKPRCETLITFMVDSVNRWLSHPKKAVRDHIEQIFGTDECFNITGPDRAERLRDLYQRQLKKRARFVRYFEMRNQSGHAVYFLFFAGNHRLGHIKMKEAMWAVDPDGEFRFSDLTNSDQRIMFGPDQSPLVWVLIYERFKGRKLEVREIREFIEDDTPLLAKHMRAALLQQESTSSAQLEIDQFKSDGKPRRKSSFPDEAIITFK
jgi:three-Cys-motif partner protein